MATQFNPAFIMELMLDKVHTTPARLDATKLSGIAVHAAIGGLSAFAVFLFLIHCAVVAYYNRRNKDDGTGERIFIFTQLGFYVVCLLVADLLQAVAGVLQATWAAKRAIKEGPLCTTQGVLFQTGSLGNAIFTSVIAVHTLFTLVLRRNFPYWVVLVVIAVSWIVTLFLELAIPAIVQAPQFGPYYGLSGPWCSITAGYPLAKILIHYFPVLLSALLSIILYLAIFFYLRGNLVVQNSRVAFHFALPKANLWIGENPDEEYRQFLGNVAYKMLWYPVVYVALTLPMVVVRLVAMNGIVVPFPVWIFAGCCVSVMGLANLIILVTTRKVIGPLPFIKQPSQTDTLVDEKPRPFPSKGFRESFMSKDSGRSLHTPRSYNGTGAPAEDWNDQYPRSADYAQSLSRQAPTITTQTQRFVANHRATGSIDSPIHGPGRPIWADMQRQEPVSPLTGDLGVRPQHERRNSNPASNRLSDASTLVGVDASQNDKTGLRARNADSIIGLYSQRSITKPATVDRGRTLTRTPSEMDYGVRNDPRS